MSRRMHFHVRWLPLPRVLESTRQECDHTPDLFGHCILEPRPQSGLISVAWGLYPASAAGYVGTGKSPVHVSVS